ncbi:MAG: hypothetical protein GF418_12510 [Chitinivibrionales bacterium]|nr:hypothetical protein [Chitinivibrionales bacterium]MBD3396441.1 hypothetical protein [Chitinivibrionales bacterium]
MRTGVLAAVMCVGFSAGVATAEGDVTFDISGSFSADITQIVNSSNVRGVEPANSDWLDGYLLQTVDAKIVMAATAREKLKGSFALANEVSFGLPDDNDVAALRKRGSTTFLESAYLSYLCGDPQDSRADLTLGYFSYNYYPDSRVLGGYLFKTGIHPGYIISGNIDPKLRGLLFHARMREFLHHNIFVTTPENDLSLTYLFRAVAESFSLDAAFMAHRVVPYFEGKTDLAKEEANQSPLLHGYRDEDGTRIWYKKSGFKLVGRLTLDFKKMLGLNEERFSSQAMRLYAEAALLGIKNYPGYYERISERVPVMAGVSIPTLKLLDVLAFEIEYYGSPFYNNPIDEPKPLYLFEYSQGTDLAPSNMIHPDTSDVRALIGEHGKGDNIRWAVYAERTFGKSFSVGLRVASDHWRERSAGWYEPLEMLHGPDEWYWYLNFTARL